MGAANSYAIAYECCVRPTVTFVGTGEATDPALPNTSLLYRGHRTLLLDCGYAVPHALWAVESDPRALDGIYVSHLHADHAFGLPAVLIAMRNGGRRRPLDILVASGKARAIQHIADLGYPTSFHPDKCFPIRYVEIPPQGLDWGKARLSVAQTHHRHVVNHALRVNEERYALAYSGDGAPTAASMSLYANAGTLVHECFSTDAEGCPQGHACLDALVRLTETIAVGELCLLHAARHQTVSLGHAVTKLPKPPILPSPGDVRPVEVACGPWPHNLGRTLPTPGQAPRGGT